jgi:hypothetical protein
MFACCHAPVEEEIVMTDVMAQGSGSGSIRTTTIRSVHSVTTVQENGVRTQTARSSLNVTAPLRQSVIGDEEEEEEVMLDVATMRGRTRLVEATPTELKVRQCTCIVNDGFG